jgi:death-on-curing protein
MNPPPFLTKDQVLYIHEQQLIAYGGQDGIRAPDLLDSALAVPQGGFGDEYFHSCPYGMAAAYAYHIAEN